MEPEVWTYSRRVEFERREFACDEAIRQIRSYGYAVRKIQRDFHARIWGVIRTSSGVLVSSHLHVVSAESLRG